MDNKKIVELLNKDRADELAAIMQYMGHHYEAQGTQSLELIDAFKDTAKDEMGHAEKLAERIVYLGGVPVTSPSPFKRGGEIDVMVRQDLSFENAAIDQYKQHIKEVADSDPTTRLLLETILSDEEEHANQWETVLGIRK